MDSYWLNKKEYPFDNAKDSFSGYETWLQERDTAQKSIRAYLSDAHQFAEWFKLSSGEAFSLGEVDWRDVQDWRNCAEQDFKPATVNRRLSSLRTLFAWAIELELVAIDPTIRADWRHLVGAEAQVRYNRADRAAIYTLSLSAPQPSGQSVRAICEPGFPRATTY